LSHAAGITFSTRRKTKLKESINLELQNNFRAACETYVVHENACFVKT